MDGTRVSLGEVGGLIARERPGGAEKPELSRGHSAKYTASDVNNMMIKCRIRRITDVRRM
jgi:hypothetical protein